MAENTSPKIVFDEVLATAERDIVTKDISRLRGGWPMQDAFYVSCLICFVLSLLDCATCSIFNLRCSYRVLIVVVKKDYLGLVALSGRTVIMYKHKSKVQTLKSC